MSFILSVHPKWAFYRPGAVVSIVYMVGMCNGIPKFALFSKNLSYPFVGNYLHTTGQTSGIRPCNHMFYTSFYVNYQLLQANGSKAAGPKINEMQNFANNSKCFNSFLKSENKRMRFCKYQNQKN